MNWQVADWSAGYQLSLIIKFKYQSIYHKIKATTSRREQVAVAVAVEAAANDQVPMWLPPHPPNVAKTKLPSAVGGVDAIDS